MRNYNSYHTCIKQLARTNRLPNKYARCIDRIEIMPEDISQPANRGRSIENKINAELSGCREGIGQRKIG